MKLGSNLLSLSQTVGIRFACYRPALLTKVLPDAIDVSMSGMPSAESLVQLFRGEANSDALRVQALPDGSFTSNDVFHEARIGSTHSLFVHNSVLMIPDFLTSEECHEQRCHGQDAPSS